MLLFRRRLIAEWPDVERLVHRRRARRLANNAEAIVGKRVRVLHPSASTPTEWCCHRRALEGALAAGDLPPGPRRRWSQLDGLCLPGLPLERSTMNLIVVGVLALVHHLFRYDAPRPSRQAQ